MGLVAILWVTPVVGIVHGGSVTVVWGLRMGLGIFGVCTREKLARGRQHVWTPVHSQVIHYCGGGKDEREGKDTLRRVCVDKRGGVKSFR